MEADVQRRLIEDGAPGVDKAAGDHLSNIEAKLSELADAQNAGRLARRLGEAEAPRLFVKKLPAAESSADKAASARAQQVADDGGRYSGRYANDDKAAVAKLGQEAIVGHAQSPKLFPWRPNPDGSRNIQEAVAIAGKYGVDIPDDILIQVSREPMPEGRFAEYLQLGNTKKPTVAWEDFYNRFEQIPVRVNPTILNSDEAIVAVLGHEMHELNSLRELFAEAGGRMPTARLYALIRAGVRGNLHDQAWDVADRLVSKMREQ